MPLDYMRIAGDMPKEMNTVTTTASTDDYEGWIMDMSVDPASGSLNEWLWYRSITPVRWARSKDKIKEAMRGYTAEKGKLYRR